MRRITTKHKLDVRIGFHAVPSMRQLHLHVISQDFQSDALKNKKHWNSFTSEFFIEIDTFIRRLENEGTIQVRSRPTNDACSLSLSLSLSLSFAYDGIVPCQALRGTAESTTAVPSLPCRAINHSGLEAPYYQL